VPAIVAALTRLRGFAQLEIAPPVIRRGKSGHFCDKALEGISHHAVVPNVNVLDDLETRLARLSEDEKRLFALICRSYLAAVMPDYEYRQTVVTLPVPVGESAAAEFRAVGRIPLRLGWKAVYQAIDPDGEAEAEQTLPPLSDGETAILSEPRVEAKRTQPPPRYNEGTLVDAMQNAWRFVDDPALRERLKEAKGIGTPATRAEIIKGLKRQNLLAADGKLVLPTPAGLQLFELLHGAAPALVDPGTTALWEMRLDEVVTGRADFRAVIDGIAAVALELVNALHGRSSGTVDLTLSTPGLRSGRRRPGRQAGNPINLKGSKPVRRRGTKAGQASTRKHGAAAIRGSDEEDKPRPAAPTAKMVAYVQSLARSKMVTPPDGYEWDFKACRRFLDEHAR
jgi:DNA topoisomerase-3